VVMRLDYNEKMGKVLEDNRHRTFVQFAASYTVGSLPTFAAFAHEINAK
jgi:hypothetical protein